LSEPALKGPERTLQRRAGGKFSPEALFHPAAGGDRVIRRVELLAVLGALLAVSPVAGRPLLQGARSTTGGSGSPIRA
jgi:hypothetical protein